MILEHGKLPLCLSNCVGVAYSTGGILPYEHGASSMDKIIETAWMVTTYLPRRDITGPSIYSKTALPTLGFNTI
jgi:hypothetical protein